MPIHVKHAGIWKPASMYARQGGVWHPVIEAWVKNGGVWSSFYGGKFTVIAPNVPGVQGIGTLFNNALANSWWDDIDKRLVVNGARGRLNAGSEFGGTLQIDVLPGGSVTGEGGAGGNGGNGGNGQAGLHITTGSNIIVNNAGIIAGGGGGGGQGGDGGDLIRQPATGSYGPQADFMWHDDWQGSGGGMTIIRWNNQIIYSQSATFNQRFPAPFNHGGWLYWPADENYSVSTGIYRTQGSTEPGGNGGVGAGSGGAAEQGQAGMFGSGTGGNGGALGQSGQAGSAGTVGSGFAGGLPGSSIHGYNRVIYSGNGSLVGPTTNS